MPAEKANDKRSSIAYKRGSVDAEPIINGKIRNIIEQGGVGNGDWILTYIGEDQVKKQSELIGYLKGTLGPGKQKMITSGYSYWGIGPTRSWVKACNDMNYMMRNSISQFPQQCGEVLKKLPADEIYHYVSLGVGTGRKDVEVLKSLISRYDGTHFFPVDMSPEMLRVGVSEVRDARILGLKWFQTLPLQLNFNNEGNLAQLRMILDMLNNGEPLVFSLLGNTLSNFDYDKSLLRRLTNVLKPEDLLLLELASTERADEEDRRKACYEYEQNAFREFALSSLLQTTDLDVTETGYVVEATLENSGRDRELYSLRIFAFYENQQENKQVRLADGQHVRLANGERIRVYLSRKYTSAGIEQLLESAGLEVVARAIRTYDKPFGFQLFLLRKQDKGS